MTDITNEENIRLWSKAPHDMLDSFGEGDFGRVHLLNPTILQLLGAVQGKKILDAGCGQGYLCRILAKKGAIVTGIEPANDFIEYAIKKEETEKLGITYIKEDLSKFTTLTNTFDSVVSNMVFMDIPDYESAIRNCINVLKVRGSFIFSISHPCFEDVGDEWKEKGQIVVKEYFKEFDIKRHFGYSFHRPLSSYINLLIQQDCRIVEMVEPQLNSDAALENPQYERDRHVPSYLVVKAKKSGE